MSQKDTGFSSRLAYIRWIRALGRAAPETDRELAETTGVGYAWLAKWKGRSDAPDSYEMREKFRRGLRLETTWLYDGQGTPPEPELWKRWLETPSYLRVAERLKLEVAGERPRAKQTKHTRAANEKRKRSD